MEKIYIYTTPAQHYPADGIILHWESWDTPAGHVSIPAILQEHLLRIRTEHAAWACELASEQVGGQSVESWLQCGEALSQWWCSLLYERHPKMTPHLYPVYKLRALELWLQHQDKNIRELHLVGGDALLRGTLEQFCRLSGRTFSCEGPCARESVSLLRRLYDACPPLLRSLLRFGHWWWTVRRRLPYVGDAPLADISGVPYGKGTTGVIATYFPNIDTKYAEQGRFHSRYWENLHDALSEDGAPGVRWLFIRFPSPQGDLDQCLRWRDAFRASGKDGLSFDYVEEFLAGHDLLAAWKRHRRIARRARRLEEALRGSFRFPDSDIIFWDYMAADWQESFAGWRGLERCLQQRGIANYVRRIGPQRWYTFPLENCPWERMLTHAAHTLRDKNGPVLGAQHSTIRPTDFRYFDDPRTFRKETTRAFQPDRILANGRSALSQWQAAGVPGERLGEIEALRYLYLRRTPPAGQTGPRPRLLAVTSFFADETHAHADLLARSLREGLLDRFDIVVKPHPYLPVEDYLRKLLGDAAQRIAFVDGPIADQLVPGAVVWASNSTTVALEAALRGLPLMVMQPCGDFDLCPLQDIPGLARTGSLEDVRRALADGVPAPLELDPDFLRLDPGLPRWRALLGLPQVDGRQS
ncbi:TIGR04326 family surface carbohydrate biosynthesis protein [uncultured Desulfovibrio sp.]|uniref:TIGR04326 family surface carbohydrate biosynthesis protein n=1 Tax=uncultured Desulfovibrio sp. TaxID=167968 RepID=UPI002637804C|nr:TIGR04326 family surface carbohydrate biosynthesis protein [uncultured Desulfovibrio sp.]